MSRMYKLVHEDGTLHTGGLTESQAHELRLAHFKTPKRLSLRVKHANWTHDEIKPIPPGLLVSASSIAAIDAPAPAENRETLRAAIRARKHASLAAAKANETVARARKFLEVQQADLDRLSQLYEADLAKNAEVLAACFRDDAPLDPTIIPNQLPLRQAETARDAAQSALTQLEAEAAELTKPLVSAETSVRVAVAAVTIATRNAIADRIKALNAEYLKLAAALEGSRHAGPPLTNEMRNLFERPLLPMGAADAQYALWIAYTKALMEDADAVSDFPGDHQ